MVQLSRSGNRLHMEKGIMKKSTGGPVSGVSDARPPESPAGDRKQQQKAAVAQTRNKLEPSRVQEKKESSDSAADTCPPQNPDLVLRPPIFRGFLFCVLGIQENSELYQHITSRGGKILESSDFESCSHLLIKGHHAGMEFAGSKIVSPPWVDECCKSNKVDLPQEDCLNSLCRRQHPLFLCPLEDTSELFTLSVAAERCQKKTTFVITPGSHREAHRSLVTDDSLILLIRKSYILLRQLHLAGLTLNGDFGADNFIVYESLGEISVRFCYIPEDLVKSITSEGEKLDVGRFDQIIRVTIFGKKLPGPELNMWLRMLHDADVKDLMIQSVLLMTLEKQSDMFSWLYDTLGNSSTAIRAAVLADLHQYNGWQEVINSSDGNFCLKDTFDHPEDGKSGSQRYSDTVGDLLRLLRNSRQHDALPYSAQFALVIRHHFTNLLWDLQKALYLARKKFP